MIADLLAEIRSGSDDRAEAAARQLSAEGEAGLEAARGLLAESDADLRWWAIRALAEFHTHQSISLLTEALSDPDPGVRACAAQGLWYNPDKAAVPALIQSLYDPDSLTARLAANALAATGSEAVPALLDILENGASAQRLEAARALALIGDVRSIPALFHALDEDSALLEYWANEGLERMGVGMSFFKP